MTEKKDSMILNVLKRSVGLGSSSCCTPAPETTDQAPETADQAPEKKADSKCC